MKTRKIAKLIIMIYLLVPQVVNAQQRENDQDYWIDKFFSVSFPLKSIKVNSAFGIRSDPFTGKHKRHNGLDLKARYEEVLSMFDGLVEATGSDRGSGKYIVMRYGVYMVSYCHLSQIWVRQGQAVLAGDAIGVSGNTGRSTGPHLHLTSRYHGQLDDPINLLLHIRETRKKALKALNLDGDNLSTPEDFIRRYADIAMRQQKSTESRHQSFWLRWLMRVDGEAATWRRRAIIILASNAAAAGCVRGFHTAYITMTVPTRSSATSPV